MDNSGDLSLKGEILPIGSAAAAASTETTEVVEGAIEAQPVASNKRSLESVRQGNEGDKAESTEVENAEIAKDDTETMNANPSKIAKLTQDPPHEDVVSDEGRLSEAESNSPENSGARDLVAEQDDDIRNENEENEGNEENETLRQMLLRVSREAEEAKQARDVMLTMVEGRERRNRAATELKIKGLKEAALRREGIEEDLQQEIGSLRQLLGEARDEIDTLMATIQETEARLAESEQSKTALEAQLSQMQLLLDQLQHHRSAAALQDISDPYAEGDDGENPAMPDYQANGEEGEDSWLDLEPKSALCRSDGGNSDNDLTAPSTPTNFSFEPTNIEEAKSL